MMILIDSIADADGAAPESDKLAAQHNASMTQVLTTLALHFIQARARYPHIAARV